MRTFWEGFSATAYFENWALHALSTNYFTQGATATSFQHYWSLSVEEQFYLLWPAVLIGFFYFAKVIARLRYMSHSVALGVCVILIAFLSFAFAVQQVQLNPAGAYFNTFGRVWEFMCGAVVAVYAPQLAIRFAATRGPVAIARTSLQVLGVFLIIVPGFVYSEHTPFPGAWALIPVTGTAMVIAAGPVIAPRTIRRLVEWRPVQFIGDISYSVYLWHWPLIIVLPFVFGGALTTWQKTLIFAASILLGWLTRVLVEEPGRKYLFVNFKPRVTLIAAAVSIAVIAVAATAIKPVANSRLVAESENQPEKLIAAQGDADCIGALAVKNRSACQDVIFNPAVSTDVTGKAPWESRAPECESRAFEDTDIWYFDCKFGTAQTPVWAIGDSHLDHYTHAIYPLARANNWHLKMFIEGGCFPVPMPRSSYQTNDHIEDCHHRMDIARSAIFESGVKDVVLASSWIAQRKYDVQAMRIATKSMLESWLNAGLAITVLHDIPIAGETIGIACVQQNPKNVAVCQKPLSELELRDEVAAVAQQLEPTGNICVLNFVDMVCPDGLCSGVIGGMPVFYDQDHFQA